MNKKFFVSLAIILCAVFSFTFCFANDDGNGFEKAANDVRNFVGGVENTVENAAMDVSNASKDATGDIENGMNGNDNDNGNGNGNDNRDNSTVMGSTGNDGYTATRVATGDNTVMGMTSTAWTWIIVAVAAIAIIALIWYYSMQFTNNNHNDE